MFCDLVESTQLSGKLDPEDLRDIVRAYQQVCSEVKYLRIGAKIKPDFKFTLTETRFHGTTPQAVLTWFWEPDGSVEESRDAVSFSTRLSACG
jgi:hypothetical protein